MDTRARWKLNILFTALVVTSMLACSLPAIRRPTAEPTSTPPPALTVQALVTATPSPTATAGPTSTPAPTPTPLPPIAPLLLYRQPERGEELNVDSPLLLAFDQAMDRASVERAFAIEPAVKGSLAWRDDRILTFAPAAGWPREAAYRVAISTAAKSQEGLAMREDVAFRFTTTGYLEVTQVQPAPGAVEIDPKGAVTVMFNRPVVPLVSVASIGDLPDPLALDPPLAGKGEWLNTAIYVWRPDEGFAPSTTYRATIESGLADTTGGVLAEDYAWSFTTELPRVTEFYPLDGASYVGPSETISVTFNQAMDATSVEEKFALKSQGGQVVAGTPSWSDDGTVLYYLPDAPLPRNTTFTARVDAGAMGARGSEGTARAHIWTFTTVDEPRILKITPADGAQNVSPYSGVYVQFSAPMDPQGLPDNLSIEYHDPNAGESGGITPTAVYSYWYRSDTELSLSFGLRASSAFTVTLGDGLRDRYGKPVEQGAVSRFTTRELEPNCYFALPDRVGTFNAYTTTTVIVGYRNISRLELELYSLGADRFMSLVEGWQDWQNFSPQDTALVRAWSMSVSPPLNKTRVQRVPVVDGEGKSPAPGLYYLRVKAPEMQYDERRKPAGYLLSISRTSVIVKRTGTSAMVWVTDLQTGEPVRDARVTLRTLATQGALKGSGTTGTDGIYTATFKEVDMWAGIYALVEREGDLALTSTQWNQGISPWDFGIEARFYAGTSEALFYTDRPIYRPGQTVYFKGVVRLDDDARYSMPEPGTEVEVTVEDSQGRELYKEKLRLSDMGTVHGEVTLDQEAALGHYAINARYDDSFFGTSFRVAEYRKPEYEVDVQADRDQYVHGDTVNVTAHATYYFGGPVAGAKARWALLSQDWFFRWEGPGWYDWAEWEWAPYRGQDGFYAGYGELVAEGTGETDAEGRFTFSVPADIADKANSQAFTLEVTVTDVNNQEVSNRVQAVVHRGLFYIGLAPRRYVGQAGVEGVVDVKVVDIEHASVADQDVQVVFMERRWYSAQKEGSDGRWYWEWEVEDIPVYTTTVRTGAEGDAQATFTPQSGGSYKVRATAQDARDNEVRSATYLWVSSAEWVSWRRENNDRIELVADKKAYKVGDIAEIMIPSPFRGPIAALLTIERGDVIDYRVITLEGNSETVQIPIIEGYVPNVFVSVVLVKGMDESNPLSAFKVGYIALPVSTETKVLNVTLTPDRDTEGGETYRPRDTVVYDVQVTDHTGRGVETELSLDLVDLAVLALTGGDRGISLLDRFYYQRGVGIQTSASLILSVDRVAAELPVEEEGKGGGGGLAGEGLVRTRFADTAYWNPALRTDAEGRAQVEVDLPDNLTTWRLRGRGVTADTLVGEGSVDVVSTLELLVRTVAPRFFVVGDRAMLSVVAHNNTGTDLDATIALQGAGLEIAEGPRTVHIAAKGNVKVDWQVTVGNVEQVVLRASAQGGDLADAVEIVLPVYVYSTPEVVATAGQLDGAGERLEAIILPQRLDPTQGELTVQVDPSLAAGMRDGLDYLEHYPYECIEQTVSRWLPNVLTYRALRDLGIENAELEESLPGLVRVGLQRVYNEQHYDGGWGWWRYGPSNPFLTAYVLLGLVKADEAGLTVDDAVIESAVGYLRKQFKSPTTMGHGYEFNRQAFILYVLAEAGSGDLARSVRLAEERDKLSNYAKAYLAMALGIVSDPGSARVQTLLSDLSNAAILSASGAHWEEEWTDRWAMNTDTRSTAIVVDALTHLSPGNALLPNAVRWLMVARKAGHWETTQETAWALIALTDYMAMTGELEADYSYVLALNDRVLDERAVEEEDVSQSFRVVVPIADLLEQEVNRVKVIRDEPSSGQTGKGRLYYAMYLRTYLPVEEVKALSRGIMVARQYQPVDCDAEAGACASLDGAQAGEVVRVKITLVAPNDLHYLVVEDPLPAGCEAVDQSLKTTSVVSEGPEMEAVDEQAGWGGYGWGWQWFTHSEIRDEKVALFADYLPRGTYEYTYLIRASVPGEFLTMPTLAYEMYFPEVWGRSDGTQFTVDEG